MNQGDPQSLLAIRGFGGECKGLAVGVRGVNISARRLEVVGEDAVMVGLSRIIADGEPCRLDGLIVPARRFEAVGEAGGAGGCRRVACDGPSTLVRGLLEPVEIPQRHGEAVMD